MFTGLITKIYTTTTTTTTTTTSTSITTAFTTTTTSTRKGKDYILVYLEKGKGVTIFGRKTPGTELS